MKPHSGSSSRKNLKPQNVNAAPTAKRDQAEDDPLERHPSLPSECPHMNVRQSIDR